MDGLLIVDKPSGPTSHDVVARMRRVLREKRIGHTGTLDPLATGVLPLVLGRATRLARFLSGSDKIYEARIRLGSATDTADAEGAPLGPAHEGPLPDRETVDRALDAFRGSFLQRPPAHSAKKIAGVRSYELARDAAGKPPEEAVRPEPVPVRVAGLEILDLDDAFLTLRVQCSAGFYVRSLAHDLGERLGVGAHLAGLRRTLSAGYGLSEAIPLADAEREPARASAAVIPMRRMLTGLPAVTLGADEVRKAVNGRDIPVPTAVAPVVRLLDEAEELVGLGEPCRSPGLLHPSVILR
jgi:tRNA pseudouridine55 synthase